MSERTRDTPAGSPTAGRALDASNFFLADVRDGLGPYLAVYLLTVQKWDEASIGLVMSIAAAAGLLAQTPMGALVDSIKAKRAIMVAAAVLVTCFHCSAVAQFLLGGRCLAGDRTCRGSRLRSCAGRRDARHRGTWPLHAADRPQ